MSKYINLISALFGLATGALLLITGALVSPELPMAGAWNMDQWFSAMTLTSGLVIVGFSAILSVVAIPHN